MQADYESEGIDWSYVKFNDNKPCLALLDNRYIVKEESSSPGEGSGFKGSNQCLFSILDDVSFMNTGLNSNGRFLASLHSTFAGKSECYTKPRLHADALFEIKHYAGSVTYNVEGFVEKNVENLHQNVRTLVLGSSEPLIANEIFYEVQQMEQALAGGNKKGRAPQGGKEARQARMREASVSLQFRSSLNTLVELLDSTRPRYVRCISPNPTKRPKYYHATEILRQLQCAGMMEAIRIRQQGYALRESHQVLYKRYAPLVPGANSLPVSKSTATFLRRTTSESASSVRLVCPSAS